MTTREVMPLTQVFVSICDPRSGRQVRHDLSELLTVAVCAVLCSADEFSEIEAWAKERIDRLYKAEQWADLKSFAIVERERIVAGKPTRERRYYISSLPADATRIAHAVRSHWEVENRLHWCLDVQFNEDQSTVCTDFTANNFAIVRHIVMNLLR